MEVDWVKIDKENWKWKITIKKQILFTTQNVLLIAAGVYNAAG